MFHAALVSVAHAGAITDATPVAGILQNVLEFLLSIVGVLGIIGLVIAGFLYLSAAGNMRQTNLAKTMTVASLIGIIIALGALVIVSQLSKFFS